MIVPLSRLQLFLAATSVLLSGVLSWELSREVRLPDKSIPVDTSSEPHRVAPVPADAAMPNESTFAEISERPLFSSTRRPAPPPAAAPAAVVAPAPPPPPPRVSATLLGIVAEPEGNLALIKVQNAATAVIVSEGETIGGWQVSHILEDRVVLTSGETEQEVLFPKPSGGTSSSPVGRPPTTSAPPRVGVNVR